jgi:hypothetical protein
MASHSCSALVALFARLLRRDLRIIKRHITSFFTISCCSLQNADAGCKVRVSIFVRKTALAQVRMAHAVATTTLNTTTTT